MRHGVSQACFMLGLLALSGCVSHPLPTAPPALPPCPATVQVDNNKVQSTTQAALQKRLQERERTIAERDQQIEVLWSQLDALKQIDQDSRHRKRLVSPAPIVAVPQP
jgi:hypothetical protein